MAGTLALLTLFSCGMVASSAQPLQGCTDGWSEFEGSCYQLQQGLTGVEEYRLVCQAVGGDLVSIHSQEENAFLVTLLAETRMGYTTWTWTGGKCLGHDCTWSDGSAWDFQLFGEGQPNSSGWVVFDADHWSDVRYADWGNTDAVCKV
eukprot:TRINITY_DN42311_c0_g1_i1.p1 TRINITY_DN42311_c0_g1~~TRINITY_DN42311_c0_g1_i1.p1  ORF type:complete len:148 (-),score=32.16 TRINITY_DN42311_c0_g1_i1:42-485(-)